MVDFFNHYYIVILITIVNCQVLNGNNTNNNNNSHNNSTISGDFNLDIKIDEDSRFIHTENGYIISLSILLLLVITLTSFISKKYKIRILPDATLCLLYGIIIGILIRHIKNDKIKLEHGWDMDNMNITTVPEYILNTFHQHNYVYKLQGMTKKIPKEAYYSRNVLIFDPEIFFYMILPPIMLVAGMRMNKKYFIKNFGTVITISIVGSMLTAFLFSGSTYVYTIMTKSRYNNTILTASECMLFGAIVAPTDPVSILNVFNELKVEPTLNSIVFGESALNDIVSLVLYDAVEDYMFESINADENVRRNQILKSIGRFVGVLFGSIILGLIVGAVGAIITKVSIINEYPVLEMSFYVIISYSSYLIGEMLQCTGVVSILFCGMFNSHYTNKNLSYDSRKAIRQFFDLIDFFATNFVFSYIGISLFAFPKHEWDVGFICWSVFSLIIARAIMVYGLCFLLNIRRNTKLSFNSQHILFVAGLKGAVSFALAIRNTITKSRQIILSTTLTLVLITVLVFGSLISKIMKRLNIQINVPDEISDDNNDRLLDTHNTTHGGGNVGQLDNLSYERDFIKTWNYYDTTIFTPLFTKAGPPLKIISKDLLNRLRYFCCCIRKSKSHTINPSIVRHNVNEDGNNNNNGSISSLISVQNDDKILLLENESVNSSSNIYGFSVDYHNHI